MKKNLLICLFLITSLALQGCVSAALSGCQAVYNRQSLQKSATDSYITIQANQAITKYRAHFEGASISVATFNRVVLLTGQVKDQQQHDEATKLVSEIDHVKKVYNVTSVSSPSSSLTDVSDSYITAKIKSKFMASDDVDPTHIKVVTDNGTVYLMGTVFPSEAHAAVYFARTTHGVQNVVKIFEYMRISKS